MDRSRDPRAAFHAGLAAVRERIAEAEQRAGREVGAVTLVAVSKTFPAAAIEPVIAAGQRVFGENRVQETAGKWPALHAAHEGLSLHLVGQLQSNKARDAVSLFDAIHSLDRDSLASALARAISQTGRHPLLFVQVNTGEEPNKGGVPPLEVDRFVDRCRTTHGLTLGGLMCIPPEADDPAPHFALLAKMARRNSLEQLSMGMSADFELAIRFGATHVRAGSAIFGGRG